MGTFHAKRSHEQNTRREPTTIAVAAIVVGAAGVGAQAYGASENAAAIAEANEQTLAQRRADARALKKAEPIAIEAEEAALDIEVAGLQEATDVEVAGLEAQVAEERRIRDEEVARLDEITAGIEAEEEELKQRSAQVSEDVEAEVARIQDVAASEKERLEAEKANLKEGQEELGAQIDEELRRVDETTASEIERLNQLAEEEEGRISAFIEEIRQERVQLREDFRPFIEPGVTAIDQLATGEGITERVRQDPRTALAIEEGGREIRRAAARRGSLFSGAALEEEQNLIRDVITEGITREEDRLQTLAELSLSALQSQSQQGSELLGIQQLASQDLSGTSLELSKQLVQTQQAGLTNRLSILDIGSDTALGFSNLGVDLAKAIGSSQLGFSEQISGIAGTGIAAKQAFSSQELQLADLATQTGLEKSATITKGQSLIAGLEADIAKTESDLISDLAAAEAASERRIGDIKAETQAALGPIEGEIQVLEEGLQSLNKDLKPSSDLVGRFITADSLSTTGGFSGITKAQTTASAPANPAHASGTFEILASGKFKDAVTGKELTFEEAAAATQF